ncbi:tRNA (adenosine(37)-N6)-threonylcarbamoyltransferase complex dimerization subunit type 1 TsaB [bacterium]|nr:tRNA (adenosine(37)-N6)-threonylcarbamoyltransferase complex dimerization subunit type 1 TsaB [bacterium]NBX72133.1 tRNA (adenosine(37)-N6)-threonylcarbamoyltransferase complex dimerization subunit type 1 TsaB [bacterium]
MNNILAVDTSLTSCSIFLRIDGKSYHRHLKGQAAHAEQFFSWIHELAQIEPNLFQRLNVLGLCLGPGRFNGLRVGMTFITTLMALFKMPAYVCTSHQLLAEQSKKTHVQGYAIFAKYNHAYWCLDNDWMNTSLVSFDKIPENSVVLDMPMVKAVEHHDSLDIANIISLINQKKIEIIDDYRDITPLYTANLC